MIQLRKTFGRDFWDDTFVRAIKTFAQTLVGILSVAAFGVTAGFLAVDILGALSVAGAAAVLAILTAVAGAQSKAGEPQPRRALDEDAPQDATAGDLTDP